MASGCSYEKKQICSHIAILKKDYRTVYDIRENSGFEWDETRQLATADKKTWDEYIVANPRAQTFRTKPFVLCDDLELIYTG